MARTTKSAPVQKKTTKGTLLYPGLFTVFFSPRLRYSEKKHSIGNTPGTRKKGENGPGEEGEKRGNQEPVRRRGRQRTEHHWTYVDKAF